MNRIFKIKIIDSKSSLKRVNFLCFLLSSILHIFYSTHLAVLYIFSEWAVAVAAAAEVAAAAAAAAVERQKVALSA